MKWWRRRKRETPADPRSDLTRTGGRFFAPTSPWNRPLHDSRAAPHPTRLLRTAARQVVLAVGVNAPTVTYAGPNDPNGLMLLAGANYWQSGINARIPTDFDGGHWAVLVDLEGRTVISGTAVRRGDRGWVCDDLHALPLGDTDGWGSLAAGLVLERELLAGKIPHAVALEAPDPELYGRVVRLADIPTRLAAGGEPVARALHDYGGLIVAITEEPSLIVRCERSTNASGLHVGATYRAMGIGGDLHDTRIPIEQIEVLA